MSLSLKPYPEYKDSGVPWLSKVPKHWSLKPALVTFRERQEPNKDLQVRQVLSLSFGRIVKKHEDALHGLVPTSFETYQVVEPGNVILRLTDLQNDQRSLRVGLARDRGIITSAYLCLSVRGQLVPEFAYYFLYSADVQKVFYGMGAGLRQSIGFADLRRLPIVIPNEEEQRAIVAFLNVFGMRTDRVIRAKRRIIDLLNEQKDVIVQRAVTRGVVAEVQLRSSGFDWLGEVPDHWEVKSVKRFCDVRDGTHDTPDYVERSPNSYPLVTSKDLQGGKICLSMTQHISRLDFEQISRRSAVEQGDVLMPMIGTIGGAVRVQSSARFAIKNVALFKAGLDHRSEWLAYVLDSASVRVQFALLRSGGVQGFVGLGALRALTVPYPPLSEQQTIANYLEIETTRIDALMRLLDREISAIREYRTRLIVDVVTGKLDVREVQLPASDQDIEPTPDSEPLDMDEFLNVKDVPESNEVSA